MNAVKKPLLKQNKPCKNSVMVTKTAVIGKSLMGPPLTLTKAGFATPTNRNKELSSSERARSTTSNSKTMSSRTVTDDSNVILAITEGRGQDRAVVGIAAIDMQQPVLILCEITDTETYTNTLTKINILRPVEVLIPSTFVENAIQNRMFTILKEKFANVTVSAISRSAFNRSKGFAYVSEKCAATFSAVSMIVRHKFYALAAAGALLDYVEQVKHIIYSSRTIKVEYQEPENTTIIDIDTSDRLELVACYNVEVKNSSLFAILDQCASSVGRRALRATILQPPCVQQVIEERLDCVQELLESPQFMSKLKCVLGNLSQISDTLRFGSMVPPSAATVSERQLNYTLNLKSILNATEALTAEMAVARHPVLRAIYTRLQQSPCSTIRNLIANVVNEDAHPAKGQAGDLQRCFAIKSGLNGFLDVARKTYSEGIDDMRAHVAALSTLHNLPLRVQHSANKGFHIVFTLSKKYIRNYKITDLPDIFIQAVRYSNHISMTTMDMIHFGVRLKSNSQEIQKLSNLVMYQMLLDIKPYIGYLYELCDDVGTLDLLCSLALASSASGYIRPRFAQFMQVEGAKHPLLEYLCSAEPICNPIFASDQFNMHVITGPNMSGKSVYIRQICLVQIMAQIGCFVPARSATLRLCNHVYARIGVDDNIELNASSFMVEMKEMQYVFNTLTDSSLVIIDELCRATSSVEGAAMSFAMCEKLRTYKAFSFIATHFVTLTRLANLYFNVTNWHMEAIEETRPNNTRRLKYTHKLEKGVTNIERYGLKLAQIIGGSKSVSARAEHILNQSLPLRKCLASVTSNDIDFLRYKTEADLKLLKQKGQLTPQIITQKLQAFFDNTGLQFDGSSTNASSKATLLTTNTDDVATYVPMDHIEIAEHSNKITFDSIQNADSQQLNSFDVSSVSHFSTTDPIGNYLNAIHPPLNHFQNDSRQTSTIAYVESPSFFNSKPNTTDEICKIVSDLYNSSGSIDNSFNDNSADKINVSTDSISNINITHSYIASLNDETTFFQDLINADYKTSTPKPSNSDLNTGESNDSLSNRIGKQYSSIFSSSSSDLNIASSTKTDDIFRSPSASPRNDNPLRFIRQHQRPKQPDSFVVSSDASFKSCMNIFEISVPSTSDTNKSLKRQVKMDDFLANIKKRKESDDVMLQMCPSKKQLAKMERIAVGHRDKQGHFQIDFDTKEFKSTTSKDIL